MRLVVTNDDGVHAPGLAALTRALSLWASEQGHEVVVVAPNANYSGASAAVGTVYERESIAYTQAHIEGAEDVPAYGLDASPALSTIVAALGGFGPKPDLVVSGINLGVNVGRSVLHSGTVGAVLTGAQLGMSGLAVSLRANAEVEHWDTAATLAVAMIDVLAAAPPRTVLNLNVPSVALTDLRGVRRGRVSTAGLIKSATTGGPNGAADGAWSPANVPAEGEVHLRLGPAVPKLGELAPSGTPRRDLELDPDAIEDDAVLVSEGWASITPLHGVHADESAAAADVVGAALMAAATVSATSASTPG